MVGHLTSRLSLSARTNAQAVDEEGGCDTVWPSHSPQVRIIRAGRGLEKDLSAAKDPHIV